MDQLLAYFLKPENGILGVLVVILASVIIWEEKQKINLREENKELATELKNLAEKRVADLERIKDTDFALLEKIRATESDKSDKIKEMVSSVLSITQNLQTLFNMKGKNI